MSLVNDLLINLEERRGGQRTDKGVFAGLDSADDALTLREEPRVPGWIWRVIFLLVLGTIFYFIWVLLSTQPSAVIVQANQSPVSAIDTIEANPVIDTATEADVQPQLRLESSLMRLPAINPLPLPAVASNSDVVSGSPRLLNVDISETGQDVVLRLDLTAMPSYRHYQLDAPARLVLELEDTTLAQSIAGNPGSNFIRAIRHNADSANVSDPFRLVFDLATAVTVTDEQVVRDAGNTQLTLKLQSAATQRQAAAADSSRLPTDLNTAESEVEIVTKDDVSMQRRPAERARIKASSYQQALRYYQQADYMRTLSSVELHLKSEPDDIQAIHLQALALISSGQLERADNQLYEATRRLPEANELKQLYAHLLMRQNKLADAVAILYISPPLLSEAPDYHALLAAALQQLGQHVEASSLYADLVQLTPAQSVWWMGLGISLEEMGRVDEALAAYRRALDSGRLSADLTDYVAARIQTLSNRLAEPRNS